MMMCFWDISTVWAFYGLSPRTVHDIVLEILEGFTHPPRPGGAGEELNKPWRGFDASLAFSADSARPRTPLACPRSCIVLSF